MLKMSNGKMCAGGDGVEVKVAIVRVGIKS